MTDHPALNAEQKLAVRNEVERTLTRLAAVFGIANLAVVAGGIWFMWTTVTDRTAGLPETVKAEVLQEIKADQDDLRNAVNTANRLIGKLEQSEFALRDIETDIGALQQDLDALGDRDAIAQAATFLQAWRGAPDADAVLSRVDKVERRMSDVIEMSDCAQPRVVTGKSPQGGTNWTKFGGRGYSAYASIDTSGNDFASTPTYFASLGGERGHWFANGAANIHDPSKEGFSVYVRWLEDDYGKTKDITKYAKDEDWYINWIAVGC